MPKLPGINHQRAVKAFEKAGFWIVRQGKHVTMTKPPLFCIKLLLLTYNKVTVGHKSHRHSFAVILNEVKNLVFLLRTGSEEPW